MFVRGLALLAGENSPLEGLCNLTMAHMGVHRLLSERSLTLTGLPATSKLVVTQDIVFTTCKCKSKVFPLQARLWPRGWVEV